MIQAIFLGTIIPLIFLIIVLKGENRLMMAFFSWGLIAFVLSLSVNNLIVRQSGITVSQLSVTWAPVVEEFFKALPLVCFLFMSKNTTRPVIYFAMASGIGFSIQENFLYLFSSIGSDGSPVFFIVIRSITACLMHGIATAIIGYGISVIIKIRTMTLPLLFGLFSLSVTFHALFNLYIGSSLKLLGMVLPVVIYIAGVLVVMSDDDPGEKAERGTDDGPGENAGHAGTARAS